MSHDKALYKSMDALLTVLYFVTCLSGTNWATEVLAHGHRIRHLELMQEDLVVDSIRRVLCAHINDGLLSDSIAVIITVARDRDSDSERLLYFGRVIFLYFFFPSTKFSPSLGRFSRNFTTRRGMC